MKFKKFLKQSRHKWLELDAHRKVLIKALLFILTPLLLTPSINAFYAYMPFQSESTPITKSIAKKINPKIGNQTNGIIEIIVTGPINIPGVYRIRTNTTLNKLLYFAGNTVDKHLYLPKKYRNYSAKNWLNNNKINFQTWLRRFRKQDRFDYERKIRRKKNKKAPSRKFRSKYRRTLRYR